MKYSLIVLILLGSSAAFSQTPEFCSPNITTVITKTIPVLGEVNWFMRSAGATNEVSFASTTNGNRILNLDTEKFTSVMGDIDPVLSPDGKFIAIPEIMYQLPDGRMFTKLNVPDDLVSTLSEDVKYRVLNGAVYNITAGTPVKTEMSIAELKAQKVPYEIGAMNLYGRDAIEKETHLPTLSDFEMAKTYQSIGVLSSNAQSSRYRMIVEGDEKLMIRDYNRDEKSGAITPGSKARPACSNFSGPAGMWTLPMISKDGNEFTTYNSDTEKTQVYKIMNGGQNCLKVGEIPALVGKADFSKNKKYLAFHIDESADSGIFKRPERGNHFGVYLFDRDTSRLIPIQNRADENSYYPVFLDDDRIAFISSKTVDGFPKYFINVAKIQIPPGITCVGCDSDKAAATRAALLGRLYGAKCSAGDGSFRSAIANFSKLSPSSCEALVKSYKDEEINQFAKSNVFSGSGWDTSALASAGVASLKALCVGADASAAKASGVVK